ncbi:MAG: tetratricopeptide repeat protein, partial [Methylococcaceae bacterium]
LSSYEGFDVDADARYSNGHVWLGSSEGIFADARYDGEDAGGAAAAVLLLLSHSHTFNKEDDTEEENVENDNTKISASNSQVFYESSSHRREQELTDHDSSSGEEFLVKLLFGFSIVVFVIWFITSVAIPLMVINVALLALLGGLIKKAYDKILFSISIAGAIYLIVDYNYGWATHILVSNVQFFRGWIEPLLYINLLSGLVAAYFLIRYFLDKRNPPPISVGELSRRNVITMVCLLAVGGVIIGIQKHVVMRVISDPTPRIVIKEGYDNRQNEPVMLDNQIGKAKVFTCFQKPPFQMEGCEGESCSVFYEEYPSSLEVKLYKNPDQNSEVVDTLLECEKFKDLKQFLIIESFNEARVTKAGDELKKRNIKTDDILQITHYTGEGAWGACIGKDFIEGIGIKGENSMETYDEVDFVNNDIKSPQSWVYVTTLRNKSGWTDKVFWQGQHDDEQILKKCKLKKISPNGSVAEGVFTPSHETTQVPPTNSNVQTSNPSDMQRSDNNSQTQKETALKNIEQHVQKMLEGAINSDENIIQTNRQYLENQPKPPKGDKKAARKINEKALKLIQNQQYNQAVPLFAKAADTDPSDVEILNNYGFVLMKSRDLDKALLVLTKALTIKPDRASAWANLADVLALQGHVDSATAGYMNVYRFSKNREKTYKILQNPQLHEDSPYVREALANAVQKITR